MKDMGKERRKRQIRGEGAAWMQRVGVVALRKRDCQKLQRHVLQDPDVVTA